MGKPIVLGVEGCAADFVRKAGAGLAIEPEDDEALADAVEKLADDRALCAALGQSGRDYVHRHFDRDKLSHDYVDVIRHTLDVHHEMKAVPACA